MIIICLIYFCFRLMGRSELVTLMHQGHSMTPQWPTCRECKTKSIIVMDDWVLKWLSTCLFQLITVNLCTSLTKIILIDTVMYARKMMYTDRLHRFGSCQIGVAWTARFVSTPKRSSSIQRKGRAQVHFGDDRAPL